LSGYDRAIRWRLQEYIDLGFPTDDCHDLCSGNQRQIRPRFYDLSVKILQIDTVRFAVVEVEILRYGDVKAHMSRWPTW